MKLFTPLLLAAVGSVVLVGCANTAVPAATSPDDGGPTAVSTSTPPGAPTTMPGGGATTPAGEATPGAGATTKAAAASTFPVGQPPRPGAQDGYPRSDGIPGLTAAIAAAGHPGLQICSGDFVSLVTASGDLRGDGGEQYLVDTTCDLATASSPDEVAVYDLHGGTLARSAVLSEFTANRPKPSTYPYLWQGHTVVLTYDDATRYRLVRLFPDRVVPGVVQAFH
ncbi:hypothetical protein [Curtobacterium sp. ISL-83]|uniref:hypothetical protein n=1 Tax=Curtobacterium sp. ISL-83 TaxID=2819145 RepID=UPI001BE84AFE|nr:hypothetical protein [Curtobacterium sp. ISL-83]MBT2503894.1 hypothetical protein [Curtobacterium sp. ISL-83]